MSKTSELDPVTTENTDFNDTAFYHFRWKPGCKEILCITIDIKKEEEKRRIQNINRILESLK